MSPSCCAVFFVKCDATGPERLSCNDQWLIGDWTPAKGYGNCGECGQCPIQDNEIVDWFGAVLWGVIRMSSSRIGSSSKSTCPPESVDEVVYCTVMPIGFLFTAVAVHAKERALGRPLEVCLEFSHTGQECCK